MNSNYINTDIFNKENEVRNQFCEQTDFIISVNKDVSTPLTHREEEIIHLVENTPNDWELGRVMREYCFKFLIK